MLTKPASCYTPNSSRASSTDKLSSLCSLPSLNTLSNNLNTNNTSITALAMANHKQLTAHYKTLSLQYKQLLLRSSSSARANHLRLTLLKFLRLDQQPLLGVQTGSSSSSEGSIVLGKYWTFLIRELIDNWSKMLYVDRTCYLEAVSRIMARDEWKIDSANTKFKDLLVMTLYFVFQKLLHQKNVSLGIGAFIGKVFAHAFITIPSFADILLFTLFVKNHSIASFHMDYLEAQLGTFPEHLYRLINYKGDFSKELESESVSYKFNHMNCMNPPQITTFTVENTELFDDHLVVDLKDTDWVKRWASYDSDIFRSFLKYYIILSLRIFRESNDSSSSNDFALFISSIPGGILIYCHLYEILNSNVNMLKNSKLSQVKTDNSKVEVVAFFNNNNPINYTKNGAKNYQLILSNLPLLKIFKVIQGLIYDPQLINLHTNRIVIQLFESLLIKRAQTITPYSAISCEVLYDLFLQFCLHIYDKVENHNLCINHLNWTFWITGLIRMLSTGNMICQTKALSSLFNLWNLLPLEYIVNAKEDWIIDDQSSLIYNLSVYLVSQEIWSDFFIHWQPLIRHLYQRLIIFKIVGTNNFKEYLDDSFKPLNYYQSFVKRNLNLTFKTFNENVKIDEMSTSNKNLLQFELLPSNPILNKKWIITPINMFRSELSTSVSIINILDQPELNHHYSSLSKNSSNSTSTSTLLIQNSKKIYPFDIFDDAIYSSSLGSTSNTCLNKKITNSPTRSPNISRSGSSSTLNKVPILGNALSFFKRVSSSPSPTPPPSIPELSTNLQLPLNVTSFSLTSPKTSPVLKDNFLPSPSSSSFSDDGKFLPQQQQQIGKKMSSASLSSLNSSTTSINSNLSPNHSSSSLNISMDSIPTPPELLIKIPELKNFKYKYQLITNNESFQRFQVRIVNESNTRNTTPLSSSSNSDSEDNNNNITPPTSSSSINSTKKFFQFDDILSSNSNFPIKPKLPFEKSFGNGELLGETGIGLIIDEDYSSSSESLNNDLNNYLGLKSDSDNNYFKNGNLISPTMESIPESNDINIYKGLSNFNILGKSLNEWELNVEEYEKYIKLINEEICDNEFDWFIDPLLTCDIPLTKSME